VVGRSTLEGNSELIAPLEWDLLRLEAEAYLGEVGSRLQDTGLQTKKVLMEGEPTECILELVRDQASM
jgi:hypothetical protein